MRVQISKIFSDPSERLLVEFQSAYGIGRAFWANATPHFFTDYDVEYTIPEPLVWGQTIDLHNEETPAVSYQENTLILSGRLESIDEDGIGGVRIGTSLILVEIEGKGGFHPPAHSSVRIVSEQATLYEVQF